MTTSWTAKSGKVRRWQNSINTGAVVIVGTMQVVNTLQASDTQALIAELQATLPAAAPVCTSSPVLTSISATDRSADIQKL